MGADEATVIDDPYSGAPTGPRRPGARGRISDSAGPSTSIICGFASDDGYSYQTGPRLAERLDLPLVSYVSAGTIESAS